MNKFLNKYFNIKQMIKEKKEYREQVKRIDALPQEYQYVFNKIQKYMWSFASGDGYDMLEVQTGVLELFEEGVINGKSVLEITGEDVADFVDELLKSTTKYTDAWRDKLNRDIAKKMIK